MPRAFTSPTWRPGGANPACIIPAWREFVDEHAAASRALRGIGEPIWPDRTSAELVECQRHESLLNLAFAGTRSFHLLCPYDTEALDAAVIEEATAQPSRRGERPRPRGERPLP